MHSKVDGFTPMLMDVSLTPAAATTAMLPWLTASDASVWRDSVRAHSMTLKPSARRHRWNWISGLMLCEVLSQFTQHLLPLLCNASVSVTWERRQSDSILVSHDYQTLCYCLHITFEQNNKRWWNLCRNIGSNLDYYIIRARTIKFHTTPLAWLTLDQN